MKEEKERPKAEDLIKRNFPEHYQYESYSFFYMVAKMIECAALHRDHIKKSLLLKSRVVVSTEEPGYLKITMDDFKKIFAEEIK